LRCFAKFLRIKSALTPNTVSVFLGRLLSMFKSLRDSGRILGLLPFSGVILTERCSKSRSVHLSSSQASALRQNYIISSCTFPSKAST
jgi:hypothetical protein